MPSQPKDSLLEADREIDRIAGGFEQSLRDGQTPLIEQLASRHPQHGSRLVRELVLAEIDFRQSHQQPIDWDDYVHRFPFMNSELSAQRAIESPLVEGETSQSHCQESVAIIAPGLLADSDDDQPLAPLSLDDYLLESKVGGGGQGDVFLARQRSLGRRVAIKILTKKAASDPQSERRFLREARTLAQTNHPQIVTIHGIGRSPDDELFLVMEFVEGKDLAKQIASRSFDIREAVQITVQIARAIEHAHERGVIHRDLKPGNILWDAIRGPIVTDFGLAKDLRAVDALTLTEQMMGTPIYMAPEQAHRRFGDVSEQTDVYGLAATLHALLTGKSPIPPGPIAEVLQQLTSSEPVADPRHLRGELSPDLCAICLKGLAKYPCDRYLSIREFSQDLQRWLMQDDSHELQLPPTMLVDRTPHSVKSRLEPGGQFGRYKLIAAVSNDPSRKVFRAEDESGRPVLLKCLPAEWLEDRMKRSQFRQEVLLSCSLSHPCLAKVLEAGTLNDTEFLALEYLTGESVAQILARKGRFLEWRAIELLVPIAEALQQIHEAGIVYRDLRPQNILLINEQRPLLADVRFSEELAPDDNVTMIGRGSITSKYVAPELLLGKSTDIVSDVYTLGATLYALVTGQEPFAGERDSINLLIAKNSSRFDAPESLVPDLSRSICDLIGRSLRANPSQRPASAREFADCLSACGPVVQSTGPLQTVDAAENLLHTVWDQLDPELQDAFSLAYNKKRRTGSNRISTKDLFEAMARLGTGPLRQVIDALPDGAMPDPADAAIPIDRAVLNDQPLLSDCVRESLGEFHRFPPGPQKVTPVDLFVDVAKHGHGPSVVRLREHGVDPEAMERIVKRLGLRVVRRQSATQEHLSKKYEPKDYLSHDHVQFSVYRPKEIPPESWQPLLAFAHLSELPPDAPEGAPDPIAEVKRQAAQVLGNALPAFQSLTADGDQPIPKSAKLTFVPTGEGLEFNPPRRKFLWKEAVHREEFRFKADAKLEGQLARGRLSVYLGRLLIAEVRLAVRVARNARAAPLSHDRPTARFRRIYACVARADRSIVAEFQQYARLLRDDFLTSQFEHPGVAAELHDTIQSADVFQLYWSHNALNSGETEREWRYALSLCRSDFIRPLYWEEPFPVDPARSMPPSELLALGFQKIPVVSRPTTVEASADIEINALRASESEDVESDNAPRMIGRHRIQKKIAEGGLGEIYMAIDTQQLELQARPDGELKPHSAASNDVIAEQSIPVPSTLPAIPSRPRGVNDDMTCSGISPSLADWQRLERIRKSNTASKWLATSAFVIGVVIAIWWMWTFSAGRVWM